MRKKSLRQQKSLGAALSFLLVFTVLLSCPGPSSTAHPKARADENTETEDLHCSESCTVPRFCSPKLFIPGMAEGQEVFLSASLMFQASTTKSIPTLCSFPNPSMPGLSLHIKCSLQTHLKRLQSWNSVLHLSDAVITIHSLWIYRNSPFIYCQRKCIVLHNF